MQSGKPARNFVPRTIWTGDNLDILRGLNSETVDLIYLDPPFNSNRNYAAPIGSKAAGAAFKDTWTLDDLDVAWLGLIADRHPAMYRVIDAAGASLWLTSQQFGRGVIGAVRRAWRRDSLYIRKVAGGPLI